MKVRYAIVLFVAMVAVGCGERLDNNRTEGDNSQSTDSQSIDLAGVCAAVCAPGSTGKCPNGQSYVSSLKCPFGSVNFFRAQCMSASQVQKQCGGAKPCPTPTMCK